MASAQTSRTALPADLLALLILCSGGLEPATVIIDGFDECDDAYDLHQCSEELLALTATKVLILSRPNVAVLRETRQHEQKICVSSSLLEHDIRVFFTHQLKVLYKKLPPTCDLSIITKHLVRVCDGMFLWARLTVEYLNSPALTPSERLNTIWEIQLPEGLEAMYERILSLFSRAFKDEQELAKQVFMWLSYAKEPLTASQLHDVLYLSKHSERRLEELVDYDYEDAVILCCGGLVELHKKSYRFIHLSVEDFLQSPSSVVIEFAKSPEQSSFDMAVACLKYLGIQIPGGPLSGRMDQAASRKYLRQSVPFLPYAAKYWPSHAYETMTCDSFGGDIIGPDKLVEILSFIDGFLKSKLGVMTWIEAVYLFSSVGYCFGQLKSWAEFGSKEKFRRENPELFRTASETLELYRDLRLLESAWHTALMSKPHEIWGDVTAFTKSRFLQSTKAVEVNSLAPVSPWKDALSGLPLCTISQTSSNGAKLAVLSVWPSKLVSIALPWKN